MVNDIKTILRLSVWYWSSPILLLSYNYENAKYFDKAAFFFYGLLFLNFLYIENNVLKIYFYEIKLNLTLWKKQSIINTFAFIYLFVRLHIFWCFFTYQIFYLGTWYTITSIWVWETSAFFFSSQGCDKSLLLHWVHFYFYFTSSGRIVSGWNNVKLYEIFFSICSKDQMQLFNTIAKKAEDFKIATNLWALATLII